MSIKNLQKDIRAHEGYILSDGTLNLTHLLPKAYDLIITYNMRTGLKQEIENVFQNVGQNKLHEKLEIPYKEQPEKLFPTFDNQYYSLIEIPEGKQEEAGYIWNEDIFNYFNNISPNGYYFGSSEGDGACIGWFKCEEEF